MQEEIINKVANSGLITIDLEDYFPKEELKPLDIKIFLWQELVVKEKEFRKQIKDFDWSKFKDKNVFVYCSVDAIIPNWAYMLICLELLSYAKYVVKGTKEDLIKAFFIEVFSNMDFTIYNEKRVIIKGCNNLPVPEAMYPYIVQKLKPFAKSIMFGEACSTVPLYKRK